MKITLVLLSFITTFAMQEARASDIASSQNKSVKEISHELDVLATKYRDTMKRLGSSETTDRTSPEKAKNSEKLFKELTEEASNLESEIKISENNLKKALADSTSTQKK